MSEPYPMVDVSVVLITNSAGELLLSYNPRWESFGLAMSGRHDIPGRVPAEPMTQESALTSAARAAAELFGRPINPSSITPLNKTLEPWLQSGRDGVWRRYTYTLFSMQTNEQPNPLPGHHAVWVKPKDLDTLVPIASSLVEILKSVTL
jgi:hypothetical protein